MTVSSLHILEKTRSQRDRLFQHAGEAIKASVGWHWGGQLFSSTPDDEGPVQLTDLTEDPTFGVRHQVLPLGVKRPDVLQTSNESAFFVEKHHTKIKKATKASFVFEVAEAMLNDENTALVSLIPDCIDDAKTRSAACARFSKMRRIPTTSPRKR